MLSDKKYFLSFEKGDRKRNKEFLTEKSQTVSIHSLCYNMTAIHAPLTNASMHLLEIWLFYDRINRIQQFLKVLTVKGDEQKE